MPNLFTYIYTDYIPYKFYSQGIFVAGAMIDLASPKWSIYLSINNIDELLGYNNSSLYGFPFTYSCPTACLFPDLHQINDAILVVQYAVLINCGGADKLFYEN